MHHILKNAISVEIFLQINQLTLSKYSWALTNGLTGVMFNSPACSLSIQPKPKENEYQNKDIQALKRDSSLWCEN